MKRPAARLEARRAAWLALLLSGAAGAAGDDAEHARLHFVRYCSGCHQADGSGAPARGIPSMRGTLGLFLRVPGGREFIAQVPGVMNAPLTDREVASLLNWLLPEVARQTLPADASPYTAAEIARLRLTRPLDVMQARRRVTDSWGGAGAAADEAP
jgi:mono/diheme cytochrome c family protein